MTKADAAWQEYCRICEEHGNSQHPEATKARRKWRRLERAAKAE